MKAGTGEEMQMQTQRDLESQLLEAYGEYYIPFTLESVKFPYP